MRKFYNREKDILPVVKKKFANEQSYMQTWQHLIQREIYCRLLQLNRPSVSQKEDDNYDESTAERSNKTLNWIANLESQGETCDFNEYLMFPASKMAPL